MGSLQNFEKKKTETGNLRLKKQSVTIEIINIFLSRTICILMSFGPLLSKEFNHYVIEHKQ